FSPDEDFGVHPFLVTLATLGQQRLAVVDADNAPVRGEATVEVVDSSGPFRFLGVLQDAAAQPQALPAPVSTVPAVAAPGRAETAVRQAADSISTNSHQTHTPVASRRQATDTVFASIYGAHTSAPGDSWEVEGVVGWTASDRWELVRW